MGNKSRLDSNRKVEVMLIQLSPQVRGNNKIWYEIDPHKITATINGVSDTFDFRDTPNGKLQLYDEEGKSLIKTELPEVPIIHAEKTGGELFVEILFSINPGETDKRLLFPKAMTLGEFNTLMAELVERAKTEENKVEEEADF